MTLPLSSKTVLPKTGKKDHRPIPKDLKGLRALLGVVSRGKYIWETTFDAIRDPVMIMNRSFRILRANLEAADRSGRPIQELIGQKCFRAFAHREEVCPGCPLKKTWEDGQAQTVEIGQMITDHDYQVSSYPLSVSEEGRGLGGPFVVHHYRDVTEERRLQRKLIHTEKMAAIGMVAGGVAHEINNPLAGILAFTQLLKGELPVTETAARNDLKEIEEAAKRCKKIVEDLLTFARPHQESGMVFFSLSETIETILPLCRLQLQHRKIKIQTDYETNLPMVFGNPIQLQQVFLNLIDNASRAMPQGGEVQLRLYAFPRSFPHKEAVFVEVIDHGCGISKKDLPRIFDPFFSTRGVHEGTGLGLALCYSIVQEHGGRIEVESNVGKGSLFRVVIPGKKGEV